MIEKKKIHNMVEQSSWDHVIVQTSGGKDSAVLLQYAIDTWGKDKIKAMHCVIDLDHKETRQVVKKQCNFFGVELIEVQAVDKLGRKKGILDHLLSLKKNRKTGAMVQNQWPSNTNRWCTGLFKQGPSEKYFRKLKGNILTLTGERRQESQQRAGLEYFTIKPNCKVTKPSMGRKLAYYRPILDMTESQVWAVIDYNEIPKHPCYAQGFSRAGCAICIFSRANEIKLAAVTQPEITNRILEAEKKIEHSFRYKPATRKTSEIKITVKDIIDGMADTQLMKFKTSSR